MERRSLLRFSAVGAALLSGVEWLKGDLFASSDIPHFDGVHVPTTLGPQDLNWLDRLNRAFAQPGGLPWQKWKAGYSLKWTGWKPHIDSTLLVSQWAAYKDGPWTGKPNEYWWAGARGHGFYASTPGREGIYSPGQIFDITMLEGQPFLVFDDAALASEPLLLKKAARAKIDAYKRLLGTMREHGVHV